MNTPATPSTLALTCALLCALCSLSVTPVAAQSSSPFERTVWGSAGNWQRYTLDIPAGTAALSVVLSGGSGNADLYLRLGEEPSEASFDCRSNQEGSSETCTVSQPGAGVWHLGITTSSEYSEVDVRATWGTLPTAPVGDWKQQLRDRHNFYRAQHCAVDLSWDDEIAASAQQYAERCVFAHDDTTPHGENIAYRSVEDSTNAPIDSWYSEVKDYDFAAPGTSQGTGHFTQVVWNSSTRLGCGRAQCPYSAFGKPAEWGETFYYVCRYAQGGNTTGRFAENVKPKSDGGVCE